MLTYVGVTFNMCVNSVQRLFLNFTKGKRCRQPPPPPSFGDHFINSHILYFDNVVILSGEK